jgi:hypothetical protein
LRADTPLTSPTEGEFDLASTPTPTTPVSSSVKKDKDKEMNAWSVIGTELLLVLLPFIVMSMVFLFLGEGRKIFFHYEWSLVGAVLSGQAIARFSTAITSTTVVSQRAVFVMTVMLVLCFVPSLVTLCFVLIAREPSMTLASVQMLLFLLAVLCFVFSLYVNEIDK